MPGSRQASLASFPENLGEAESINKYYFVANFPPLGHASWEIFLDIKYSEEDFYLETERLSNFQREPLESGGRKLKYDKNCVLFNFPTYIAAYDARQEFGHVYEYICVDEPNFRMVYVYLDRPSRLNQEEHEREIVIPLEYQPKNYFKNKELATLDGYYYTIYTGFDTNMIWFE